MKVQAKVNAESVPPPPDDVPRPSRSGRRAFATYSLLRLALFLAAAILLWLVHVKGALLVVLALVISGLASYVMLAPQRAAMSVYVSTAAQRRRARSAARIAREDAYADQLEQQQAPERAE